jgi:hypothetical protein
MEEDLERERSSNSIKFVLMGIWVKQSDIQKQDRIKLMELSKNLRG